MKRFKVQAQFYVQAAHSDEAKSIAEDMMNDAVSEQYEHVSSVTVLGEVGTMSGEDDAYDDEEEEDEDAE